MRRIPGPIMDASVGSYCQHPRIEALPDGTIVTVFIANFAHRRDDAQPLRLFNSLWARIRGAERPEPQLLSDPSTTVWCPTTCTDGQRVWAIWSAWVSGRFQLHARCFDGSSWGPIIRLTDSPHHDINPSAIADSEGLWVAFQRMGGGRQAIFLGHLDSQGRWSERCLTENLPDCHRPALCRAPDGPLFLAADAYVDGSYWLLAGPVGPEAADLQPLATDGPFNGQAAILSAGDAIWLAWYHRPALDPPMHPSHFIRLLCLRAGRWRAPTSPDGLPPGTIARGHFRPALAPGPGESICIAWTLFGAWLRSSLFARWLHPSGWSRPIQVEPTTQSFSRGGAKFTFSRDPDLAAAPDDLWAAWLHWTPTQAPSRIHLRTLPFPGPAFPVDWREWQAPSAKPPAKQPAPQKPQRPPVRTAGRQFIAAALDLHCHTHLSFDAVGTPDQIFNIARHLGLDGAAIADHDVTPGEHLIVVAHANHYNAPGQFIALAATEIAPARPAFGDKHIIWFSDNPPLLVSLFHPGEAFFDRGLYHDLAAKAGGLVITHDGSFLRGVVDIDEQDLRCERLLQISSTHAGRVFDEYEKFRPGVSRWPETYPRLHDALRRGFVYGLVGGSDTHHSAPEGRTIALVESLTRQALREALFARRCYATTGPWLALTFEIAGHPMGSVIENPPSSAEAVARAAADEPIARLVLVEPSGERAAEANSTTAEARWQIRPAADGHWAYVRVEFASGHLAWSSPIWLGLPAAMRRPPTSSQ